MAFPPSNVLPCTCRLSHGAYSSKTFSPYRFGNKRIIHSLLCDQLNCSLFRQFLCVLGF
jgi:hypothetical protein